MKGLLKNATNRWTLICYGLILAIFLTALIVAPSTSASYTTAVTGGADGTVASIGVYASKVSTLLEINTENDDENNAATLADNFAYYVLYATNTRDGVRTQVAMRYVVRVEISKESDVYLNPGTMYWYSKEESFKASSATAAAIKTAANAPTLEANPKPALVVNPTVDTSNPNYNVYTYSATTTPNFIFNVRTKTYTHYMAIEFTSTPTQNAHEEGVIDVSVIATQID